MNLITKFLNRLTVSVPAGHKLYRGAFEHGEAEYVYVPNTDGHILDGMFRYRHEHSDGSYERAEGEYEQDYKSGYWSIFCKFPDGRKELRTHFMCGVLSGDLIYASLNNTDKSAEDLALTIFDGEVSGHITGRFKGGYSFHGLCDDNGYPDGPWTLIKYDRRKIVSTVTENWKHGVFCDAYIEDAEAHRTPTEISLRELINVKLMNEVSWMLGFVSRGTKDDILHIRRR